MCLNRFNDADNNCKQTWMSPAPHLVLFARGVIALLHAWPALRIAVQESWGGPHSAEKRTWLVSNLVDAFEQEPLDEEEVEHLLLEAMLDEFEAEIDDGSPHVIAKNVVSIWKAACDGNTEEIAKLEAATDQQLARNQLLPVSMKRKTGDDGGEDDDGEWSDESEEESAGEEEHDSDAPPSATTSGRAQPVVDEDGFQLVQKSSKWKGH